MRLTTSKLRVGFQAKVLVPVVTVMVLLVVAIALILAWKVAGTLGADFFLLRWIGTPWRPVPVTEPRLETQPVTAPGAAD